MTFNREVAIGRLLDVIIVQIDHEYSTQPDGVIVIRQRLNLQKKWADPNPEEVYKKHTANAKKLVKNYDLDRDGKLNSNEIKKLRRPPVGQM